MLLDEYKRSLKLPEAEEILDLLIFRPSAFVLVKAIYRLPVTPNGVTLASLACGLLAAWNFSTGRTGALLAGAMWYAGANILDCADGQLARLQGSGTFFGRVIDGAADYISSIALFLGIGIGLAARDSSQWWLVAAAAASSGVHAFFFDHYQNEYISAVRTGTRLLGKEIGQFEGEIQSLRARGGALLKVFVLSVYVLYLRMQARVGPPPICLHQRRAIISLCVPSKHPALELSRSHDESDAAHCLRARRSSRLVSSRCRVGRKRLAGRGGHRPASKRQEGASVRSMSRPGPREFFRQTLKSDSFVADELINIYLLRPIAASLVWLVYPTPVTPNQVTVAAILVGLVAAAVYPIGTPLALAAAGLLVTAKDILDDADGQLARAKGVYSRRGRFLDSIGDFAVDVAIFAAVTVVVSRDFPVVPTIALGILSLLGITLRVSYHVYYQVSFLHLEDRYKLNRIVEEITDEDRLGDPVALRLQKLFSVIYTWQDRLMYRIDRWCMGRELAASELRSWYSNRAALRLSGLLGFGTEYAVLTICSLAGALRTYLFLNVFLLNGIWIAAVVHRRFLSRSMLASTR